MIGRRSRRTVLVRPLPLSPHIGGLYDITGHDFDDKPGPFHSAASPQNSHNFLITSNFAFTPWACRYGTLSVLTTVTPPAFFNR